MKSNLTQQEINEIRDLACEGTLFHSPENKQYYLIKIIAIVTETDEKGVYESAESAGYTIEKGVKP